jgi:hypothetical protein
VNELLGADDTNAAGKTAPVQTDFSSRNVPDAPIFVLATDVDPIRFVYFGDIRFFA